MKKHFYESVCSGFFNHNHGYYNTYYMHIKSMKNSFTVIYRFLAYSLIHEKIYCAVILYFYDYNYYNKRYFGYESDS